MKYIIHIVTTDDFLEFSISESLAEKLFKLDFIMLPDIEDITYDDFSLDENLISSRHGKPYTNPDDFVIYPVSVIYDSLRKLTCFFVDWRTVSLEERRNKHTYIRNLWSLNVSNKL